MKFPTKPRNIFHHTLSMFPHYPGKVQSVPYGVCQHIEAGLHRPCLRRLGHKDQWHILPWCAPVKAAATVMLEVSGEFFVFQQDNAPAHRAHNTVRLLEQATPAFIPPDPWPANSPDLNPVDYRICSIVQQQVYQSRVHDTDELKQRLQQLWHIVDQSIIDSAVDEWRKCLRACVQVNGSHFEHML